MKFGEFLLKIYKKLRKNIEGTKIPKIFPFLKLFDQFVKSRLNSEFAIVHGYKMYLHRKGLSLDLAISGIHEKLETEFIKNNIKKEDIVIDIGANIGYFTLLFSKQVGDKGKVFSFEAETENFKLLEKNVKENHIRNVILENVAVSEKEGKIKLYLSNVQPGMHRIYSSKFTDQSFIEVPIVTLDKYFENHNLKEKISFIKMDVEGSEFGVLKGMSNLLENNQKIKIMLEFDSQSIEEFGSNPKELIDFLVKAGFQFSFPNYKLQKIVPITVDDLLLENKQTENKRKINLLCWKK